MSSKAISASHVTVSGAPEGFDARLIAKECAAKDTIVCHVARDDKRMEAVRESLRFFAPDLKVVAFPGWDCLPFDRVSPNAEISAERMATLSWLQNNAHQKFVVLTTLNAVTQYVPSRDVVASSSFLATRDQRINEQELRAFLVQMGFSQSATVTEPGDYAFRGGIIDIYPPAQGGAVRLDLFGDVLDGIRQFDPATQRTVAQLDAVAISPVSEVILDAASITRFRQNYRIAFGVAGSDDPLYESVSAGRYRQGIEHWLPFFHDRLDTLFDYLPDATFSFDDHADAARQVRWEMVTDQYEARLHALEDRRRDDTVYKPVPPEQLYLDDTTWQAITRERRCLNFSALPRATGAGVIDGGGRAGRNFVPERQQENASLFGALIAHIRARLTHGAVVLTSYSEGARERLAGLIADEGLLGAILIDDVRQVEAHALHLCVWPLDQGFQTPDLTFITEQDIFGDRLVRKSRRTRRADNFLTEAQALNQGDLVVHAEHGIGRYHGLEVITAAGADHECLNLEYDLGARLFLPVENIELLSRYGQDEGQLDRLGGGAWQAKKARLKERIREMAERLIRVAAERALRKAPVLQSEPHAWEAFSARFPYEETDDQLAAIADVLDDLSSGQPMDRLICGDVGFGKTEVAMRATFAAAMSGMQVAIVAPTTLLVRQHYQSFSERFRGFPVTVKPLSRFVAKADAVRTREELANGQLDIVIGTHALLAKNIRFKDLGLLIVDEEQRFGVAHKERLKQLRSDVHVLTLSATPIPRTLQLSLTGVRDLSIIGTPPVDRLSIRTYVSEFDRVTIREALLREHYRGGHSFFVVPRVSDIPEIEDLLRNDVPEISFIVAHGQMAASQLDERMNAFYDGKYDVLLATTIVESGLDIPAANTMIIHRAEMFGLAQLYQIRGRVGRSKTRAYAYLMTKPRAPLTPTAEKRLRVLGALDTLGAGFTLASQDLDIRGAGNLLGEEQSGQIRSVGFELYQSMLEEAIARIKSGEADGIVEHDEKWTPKINLGVPVLIPDSYVSDLDVRLGLYRRLSGLESKIELEGFAAELTDRFGKLPKEVNILLLIVRIKAMCRQAGIVRLDGGPKGAAIEFYKNKFENTKGLLGYIDGQRGLAKVQGTKLVVRRDWKKASERMNGAFSIARDLAAAAKAKS